MRLFILFSLVLLLLLSTNLLAEPVEIAYDGDGGAGTMGQATPGDIELVRFSPAHPCSVLSFRVKVNEAVDMEWHIWGDDGGGMPDIENELIEPFNFEPEDIGDWVVIELPEPLLLPYPRDFIIGHVLQEDAALIRYDNTEVVEQRSLIKLGDTWYLTGRGNNYHLRATVEYFDEVDEEDFYFHNVSDEAGIGGMSRIAWADYDNDGWEDLLINGRTLYRNLGDGTFENVSEQAGITADNPASSGSWGDYNNDGWLDFFAANNGANIDDRIYRSNGDGTFTFANDEHWLYNGNDPTQASGWGDADGDGYLELYIANSEIWDNDNPNNSQYFLDYLYRYDPDDNIFWDITSDSDILGRRHYGRGVAWCDFDNDDDMDVYISNYRLHPNYLLVNQGDLTFENQAEDRGVEGERVQNAYGHTIGSAWADYDNDGNFDLFVSNLAHPRFIAFSDKCMLYRNSGDPDYEFEDVREGSGIEFFETASSVAWADYDNDGLQDLFITAVYEGRQPFFYKNLGDTKFENINYPAGFHGKCYNSWGVAWCDYDHDGDMDMAVGGNHGGLFRNDSEVGHYLQVKLQGTEANSHAYGCKASVHYGDLHQYRQVEAGMGTGVCQNMLTMHFGLGGSLNDDQMIVIDSLVVHWLAGETETWYDLEADRRYTIVQGEGIVSVPETENNTTPTGFNLTSVFPNPFNNSLRLDFEIDKPQNVQIAIYNVNGKLIERRGDVRYSVGNHTVSWHPQGIPAGNYIIQIKHDRGMFRRVVTLLK